VFALAAGFIVYVNVAFAAVFALVLGVIPCAKRQRGLRGFLRPGSGRDTVCKEARGDRIYLLGLCRGRVLILLKVVGDYYQNCQIPDYENPSVVTFWDYVVTVPKQ